MSDYTIQPYNANSYPLLKALFRAAFHSPLDRQAFTKKYNTKALGHEVIGFVAIHTATQTPAAFYGVFPVAVLVNGKEILAAQSGDTMTHPAHQRKGLFVRLATMTYEVCRTEGIALIFGQPNQNSYQGLVNRLHFFPLDRLERYDLKLRFKTLPLPKLCKKTGLFSAYLRAAKWYLKNRTVGNVHAFINPLPTDCGKVFRNQAYLNYKDEADKLFVKIASVVFWIKLTDVLWIGEASNYEAVTPQVLKGLKRLAFLLGYNTVSFNLNKSLKRPFFLQNFSPYSSEASCFLYLNKKYEGLNFIFTGADFDTW